MTWDEERIVTLETNVQANSRANEALTDALLGTRSPLGDRRDDGVIHKVDRIEKDLRNGGLKVKIPAKVWLPSTITTAGAIVVAILAIIGGH